MYIHKHLQIYSEKKRLTEAKQTTLSIPRQEPIKTDKINCTNKAIYDTTHPALTKRHQRKYKQIKKKKQINQHP